MTNEEFQKLVLEKFDKIESKLNEHDAKFDKIDARFDKIEAKLDEHDARFDKIETKLDEHDARFDKIDARLEQLEEGIIKEIRASVEFTCERCDRIEDKLSVLNDDILTQKADIRRLKVAK